MPSYWLAWCRAGRVESVRVDPAVADETTEGPGAAEEDAATAPDVAGQLCGRPDVPSSCESRLAREGGWETGAGSRSGRSGEATSTLPAVAAAAAAGPEVEPTAALATLMVGWGEGRRDFGRPGAGRAERGAGAGPVRQRLFRLGPPTNLNSRGALTWVWGISVNVGDRRRAHKTGQKLASNNRQTGSRLVSRTGVGGVIVHGAQGVLGANWSRPSR